MPPHLVQESKNNLL